MPSGDWVSLAQSFPFRGKRGLMKEEAAAGAEAVSSYAKQIAASAIAETKDLFWGVYRVDREIEVAERETRLAADIESSARAMYVTGSGRQADLLMAQLMQTEVAERLIGLRGERAAAEARLAGVTGAPVSIPPLAETREPLVPFAAEEAVARALEANPEIGMGSAEVRMGRASLGLARKEFYPDFSLGVMWGSAEGAGMSAGEDPERRWSFEAMIDLPIARGDLRDREKASRAGLRAAERALDGARARTEAEAREALAEIEAAAASIDLHRSGLVPQAEAAFLSAMASYGAGDLDFESLLLAERSFLAMQRSYHETVTMYRRALARLDRIAGACDATTLFPVRDLSAAGAHED
jgi:outer membrane protein TolC